HLIERQGRSAEILANALRDGSQTDDRADKCRCASPHHDRFVLRKTARLPISRLGCRRQCQSLRPLPKAGAKRDREACAINDQARSAATPKPASCAAPKAPTKLVSKASARLLRMGCSDIGAPTRRISTNSRRSRRMPRSVGLIAVRPEAIYQARIALDAANDATVAMPAP